MIDSLGKAWTAGWRAQMRCRHVAHADTAEAVRCEFRLALDIDTLVVAKGPSFELSKLPGRLICPKCRGGSVSVAWLPPENPTERGAQLRLIPGAKEDGADSANLLGGKYAVDEFDRTTGN